MSISIRLVYIGLYKKKTGKKEEILVVDEDIKAANAFVMTYLNEVYGLEPPFNLMVNGTHMAGAVKKGIRLKDEDELKLIPFLSGG